MACMGSHSKRCHWSGNYSDYPLHVAACTSRPSSSIAVQAVGSHIMDPLAQPPRQPTRGRGNSNNINTRPSNLQSTKSLPSVFLLQQLHQQADAAALQSPISHNHHHHNGDILVSPRSGDSSILDNKSMVLEFADYSPAVDNHNQLCLQQEQLQNQPTTPPLFFRKSASLRDFTKQDMDLLPPTVATTAASKQLPPAQQQPRRWAAGESNSSTTNATAVTASSAAAVAAVAAQGTSSGGGSVSDNNNNKE